MTDATDPGIVIAIPTELWVVVEACLDASCVEPTPARTSPDADDDAAANAPEGTSVEVTTNGRGRAQVVFTALPVQVNPDHFAEFVADAVRDRVLTGIADISSEGDGRQIRLVITLRRESDPNVVRRDVVALLGQCQHASWERAVRTRQLVAEQRTAGDAITLTEDDWWYLCAEITRRHPQDFDAARTNDPPPASDRVLDVIETGILGEHLEPFEITGRTPTGLEWTGSISGRQRNPALHMVVIGADGRRYSSYLDLGQSASIMHATTSRNPGRPTLVTIAVDRGVDRVVITTGRGDEFDVPLSSTHTQYETQVGLAFIPDGDYLAAVQAESDGTIVQRFPASGRKSPPPAGRG